MKRLPFLVLAVCGLSILGCSDTVAPVDVDDPMFAKTQNEWVPIDFTFLNVCFGENMNYVGRVKFLQTATDDGSGGFHMTFHRNWTGKATGEDSGDVYNINFVRNWSYHSRPPYPENFTQTWRNFITRKGGAGKWELILKEHYTVNANGVVTVDRSEQTADCQ